ASAVGCSIDGAVTVTADGAAVRSCVAARIVAAGASALTVERSVVAPRQARSSAGAAIDVTGGTDHRIACNELAGHDVGVRLRSATTSVVDGNRITARECAVEALRCESVEITANT